MFDPSTTSTEGTHKGDNAGWVSHDAPSFFKVPNAKVRCPPTPPGLDHPDPYRGKDACISMDSPEIFKIKGVPIHAHHKAGHKFTFSPHIAKWNQPYGLPAGYFLEANAPEWEPVKSGKLFKDTNQWQCSWKSRPEGLGKTGMLTEQWQKTLGSPWKPGSFDDLPRIEYKISPTKPFRKSSKLKCGGSHQVSPTKQHNGSEVWAHLMEGGKSNYQMKHSESKLSQSKKNERFKVDAAR